MCTIKSPPTTTTTEPLQLKSIHPSLVDFLTRSIEQVKSVQLKLPAHTFTLHSSLHSTLSSHSGKPIVVLLACLPSKNLLCLVSLLQHLTLLRYQSKPVKGSTIDASFLFWFLARENLQGTAAEGTEGSELGRQIDGWKREWKIDRDRSLVS